MSEPYQMLEPGAGEKLRFLDDSLLVLKADDGEVAHYEYIAAPSAKGSPQHIHANHDETFFVVEGKFEFTLGTKVVEADAGTFLRVERGQPHGFRNVGPSSGRIIGTFGSNFADYFRELARFIERTGSGPSPEEWIKLYGRYGTTFFVT
jgi:mannose-6-phosphate isomerase-like protein (cupin superfamily)